jgi:hypothetical protein
MPTRADFLPEPTPRSRFVDTPTHASWLHQVEIWFSILVRRLLKRGSFTSVDELRRRSKVRKRQVRRSNSTGKPWPGTCRSQTMTPIVSWMLQPLISPNSRISEDRRLAARSPRGPLLRGFTAGDLVGPYISRFLLRPVLFGAQIFAQQIRTLRPGIDYMT